MKLTFLTAALAVALAAGPAAAQQPAPAVDFSAFGQRLTDLEQRVAALEGKTAPVKTAAPGCDCNVAACDGLCPGCQCQPAAKAPTTYPQYLVGGRWVGEAEFRRAFPAAPGVAAPTGFTPGCGPAGCPTTRTIGATGAAPTSTSSTGFYRVDGTFTGADGAAIPGSTSGCANGNCAAPTTYRRGLFRR